MAKLLEHLKVDLEFAAGCRGRAGEILERCYGRDDELVKEIKARW